MKFQAICAAAMLASSAALAADPLPAGKPSQSPSQSQSHAARGPQLNPGRSAGVRRAQQVQNGLVMTGAAGVIAAVVLAATGGGGGSGNQDQVAPQMNSITTTTTS